MADDDKDRKRRKRKRKDKDRDEEKPPKGDPKPIPPDPGPGGLDDLHRLIADTPDGGTVDLGDKRWVRTGQRQIVARRGLTIRNGIIDGSRLGPAEPCLWLAGGEDFTFEDLTIIGAADTGGKFGEFGEKNHGIMTGGTKGIRLRRVTIANVGGDWLSLSDKPLKYASEDFEAEDCWFVYSRRQGISGAGIRGARFARCCFSRAQRTLFDFEAEGNGAKDFLVEDCDIDVGTRAPNFVFSIGGANREGVLNEGPFTMRNSRVYGGRITVDNRSQAQVTIADCEEDLPLSDFPKAPALG